MSTRQKQSLLIALLILVLALYFLTDLHTYVSLERFQMIRSDLLESYRSNPVLFIVSFVMLYIIAVATSLPVATVLTVSAGALFGWALAILLVIPSAVIGSTGPYLVARYLTKDAAKRKFKSSLNKLQTGLRESGWWYLLAARLSPIIPFYILNIVAGVAQLPFKQYVSATFFGIIPGTMVATYAGSQLGESTETGTLLRPGMLIALLLVSLFPLIVRYVQLKILQKGAKDAQI